MSAEDRRVVLLHQCVADAQAALSDGHISDQRRRQVADRAVELWTSEWADRGTAYERDAYGDARTCRASRTCCTFSRATA